MTKTCSGHCQATTPVEVLKAEHRVIERGLDAMERQLTQSTIDREFFLKALDFFRSFADRCHHAKEEGELFPVLESAGVPRDGGPIGCMLAEHEQGRRLVGVMADHLDAAAEGDKVAEDTLRRAAANYIGLLRQHIQKEDHVLFVMADQIIGPEEQKLLLSVFDRAEQSNGNLGKHERYTAVADELTRCSLASP
jgi:hemerythrin-like domain-containing protein